MKKTFYTAAALALALSAGSALAADLPSYKGPPVYLPPPLMWTGFYVGVNAGGALDASDGVYVANSSVFLNGASAGVFATAANSSAAAAAAGAGWLGNNNDGFIGGGQVGYSYQFGAGGLGSVCVAGVEADIQGVAGSNGASNIVSGAPLPVAPAFGVVSVTQVSKRVDYLGTVRGRIGFLFTPTLLVYATGGLAYGGVKSSTSQFQGFVPPLPFAITQAWGAVGSYSDTRTGWTVGGGLEWMFMPNWSAKAEYLYYDLGAATYGSGVTGSLGLAVPVAGQPLFGNSVWTTARFNGHIVRAGMNYHFNLFAPAPVVASY